MRVTAAIERYLRHQRVEGRSPDTLEYNGYALAQFARYLEGQGHSLELADLGADDLRGFIVWLRERYASTFTVAGRVRAVRAWGNWLEREEYLPRHPFRKVRQVASDEGSRVGVTPEQVEALLRGCDRGTLLGTRDFALILCLFSTGLRLSELLALTTADLDHARQLIVVRRGKGGKARLVPLTRPVERAIEKYLRHVQRPQHDRLWLNHHGAPLSKRGLQFLVEKRAARAGFHAHPHLFRHGAALTYLRNGGKIETLRAMLGHAKLDQTLHYARIAGVDLVEAHQTADPARSLKLRL